ncbi:hypothetical protein DL767_005043 [Monosporascus sp. MG133]|nr:hypothetical protein DL767_005043 [Monosporascus sp. MG133]
MLRTLILPSPVGLSQATLSALLDTDLFTLRINYGHPITEEYLRESGLLPNLETFSLNVLAYLKPLVNLKHPIFTNDTYKAGEYRGDLFSRMARSAPSAFDAQWNRHKHEKLTIAGF